jgi:hypothetical protein
MIQSHCPMELVTLEDRQLHHEAFEGRARGAGMAGGHAMLILVATKGGPTMLARIGDHESLEP